MSTPTTTVPPTPRARDARGSGSGSLRLTWHGLSTVTLLELRQRVRSRRWFAALAAWFVVIGGVTALVIAAIPRSYSGNAELTTGPLAFGLITFFVLGMGLLIAPTFTATSLNGDRLGGTLALLQATRLSALEIALGKLLAAWLTSAVFLLVALPFIAWSMVLGSISVWQVVVCFSVVFVLVAIVCAIGLGWSALISRPAGSTVMTYLTLAFMSIICGIVMGLLMPFTQSSDVVRVWGLSGPVRAEYQRQVDDYFKNENGSQTTILPAPPIDKCSWTTETQQRYHVDRVWWLIAANPFVVVADAAPLPPGASADLSGYTMTSMDPLAALRFGVRALSLPQPTEQDRCLELYQSSPGFNINYDAQGNVTSVTTADGTPVPITSPVKRQVVSVETPIWPWGLGFNLLLGLAFFAVAVRRLTVPYGVLPKGTRVG